MINSLIHTCSSVLDTYPKSPPQVMVPSKVMHEEQARELRELLSSKASSLTGTNMLNTLVEKAMEWIKDQGLFTYSCVCSLVNSHISILINLNEFNGVFEVTLLLKTKTTTYN